MSTIGNITVPSVAASGTFPIQPDYGYGLALDPEIVRHRFLSANGKIEQRFLLGDGLTRYMVRVASLSQAEFEALRDFWEARNGPYQPFTYNAPSDDGQSTSAVTVRFESAPLSFEHLTSAITGVGLTFVAIPVSSPSYSVASTDTRFPGASLEAALLSQVQELIPLLKITVKESGYPVMYLSDREVTIGGQLYQARLLRWDGISQAMNGESDSARFVFGNADRVMRDLAEDTDLAQARVEFSLFHVGTTIKLDLWAGDIVEAGGDEGAEFSIECDDGLDLNLDYPARTVSRACPWEFDDGQDCPWTSVGSGSFTECNKSFTDCQARGMEAYHGGIHVRPQTVNMKEVSSGWFGIGRNTITRTSQVSESVNGLPLQEVYTDSDMLVSAQIVAGREEDDFFSALGVVGQGPLSGYATDGMKHRLDGQPAHGPLPLGLRRSYGHHPVQNADPDTDSDEFSLSAVGGSFTGDRAAGVAFVEIRRTDPKGLNLSRITDHQMQVAVSGGLGGWVWSSGTRSWSGTITNPIWIAVNALLKRRGLQNASAATQEALFDVDSAEDAAGICNDVVDVMEDLGLAGTETQFKFKGVIGTRRPLREWFSDILSNCLGYWVMSNGKLKFGVRYNSSAVEAFTAGNVILDSIRLRRRRPDFNRLTANFANADYEWKTDSVTVGDIGHAKLAGNGLVEWRDAQINLVGTFGKSQAARIIVTRLREELGGITAAEWKAARAGGWSTTVLALAVEPGMVVSLTHDEAPGGSAEYRVKRWTLNSDYSIDLEVETTTDSMYDYTIGEKPADVVPDPVPAEAHEVLLPTQPWFPYLEQPDASDPLFDSTDWSFRPTQDYSTMADSSAQAKLIIEGKFPITDTIDAEVPIVGSYTPASTGGSIPSGSHITISLVATDATGACTAGSQPTSVPVAVGTNTNKITLGSITWPAGTVGYRLYASADHNLLSLQMEAGSQPSSIELTALPNVRTRGLPKRNLKFLRPRVKFSFHAGVNGLALTAVGVNTLTVSGAGWTVDEWAGRVVSVLADASDGSSPIWNFLISSNTSDTLTVSPDPDAAGVEAGDVIVIRTKADAYTSVTIGDSKFENAQYPAGMNVDEEKGRVVRIIAGTGAGQQRRIASNDSTVLTIDSPWVTTPDATSIFVVESAGWEYEADVSDLEGEKIDGQVTISVPVANYLRQTLMVEVLTVDRDGRESPRAYSPWREIYLFGDTGSLGPVGIAY